MQYALVAGGSKGIGYAIAEALARRQYNLILVGRNANTLLAAKNRLESAHAVQVKTLEYDLSLESSAEQIASWCGQQQIQLTMLCNVAGIGGANDFLALSIDQLRYMVKLNVTSELTLCAALIPLLERNAPSYILNVASMAGFAPIPMKNLYSATKSAVLFFSYALRYQLKEKNISVSCLCPGPVFTKPEIEKDTLEKLGWLGKQMAVNPGKLGEIAVQRTLNKRLIIVPGSLARFMSLLLRLLPKRLLTIIYHTVGKNKKNTP